MRRMRRFGPIAATITALLLAAPAAALGAADLTTTVTATPASLPLGGPETSKVKITVANAGVDTAMEVEGGPFPLPPQLAFMTFVGISQGSVTYTPEAHSISFGFGSILSGKSASFEFVVDDEESGRGTFSVTATTSTEDANPGDNTATVSIDVPALVPSVSSIAFGSQAVGALGPPEALTLVNQAAIPIQVAGVLQVPGSDFLTSSDGCSGTTVAPGASCAISARFAPSVTDVRTGTMTISSSTAKVAPFSVPLTGTGVVADKQGPTLVLAAPKSIKAKKFKKGFQVGITPNEAAALEVALLGTPKKGALASKFELKLFSRSLPLAAGTRKVKVKPAANLVGALRKKITVQLQVVATDAAGNRSTVTRKITVRP